MTQVTVEVGRTWIDVSARVEFDKTKMVIDIRTRDEPLRIETSDPQELERFIEALQIVARHNDFE